MGLTKTAGFTKKQVDMAAITKALGHPARLAILQFIASQQACVCGDIVEELPLSQSTVSQHLKELKEVGIIKGTIEGPSVCYCIDTDVWSRIKSDLHQMLDSITPPDCC